MRRHQPTHAASAAHASIYPPRVVLAAREATRSGICAAVEDAGFAVIAGCGDGATATAAVVRERAELCLIDAELPGALRAVAAIASLPLAPKVVVLAARPDEQGLFAAMNVGAAGYLKRDIDAWRLADELRAVAAGGIAVAPDAAARLVDDFRSRSHGRGTPPVALTDREWEVLQLLAVGLTANEIGQRLRLSGAAVHRHISSALKRTSDWGVALRRATPQPTAPQVTRWGSRPAEGGLKGS